jgi:hypothetical protein
VPRLERLWERTWWLLSWLLALAALSVFWSFATPHLCYDKFWLSGDSGIAVYNAFQVADGRALYRDIFEYRTPFSFVAFAALFRLTGPSPAAAHWATIFGISTVVPITAIVMHRLGVRRLLALFAGTVPVLVCFAAWPYPFPPWFGWPFAALTLWALQKAFATDELHLGWVARAGVFAGLYVMSIQSNSLPFAAGLTLALVCAARSRRWAAAGAFVGGGLAAALPLVVYVAAQGSLSDALYNTLVWPYTNYYNDMIHGRYPFAGIVEHYRRRGFCQQTGSLALNQIYNVSLVGIPALGGLGFLTSVGYVGAGLVRLLRPGSSQAWASPRRFAFVLGAGGASVLATQVAIPSLSDPTHTAMALLPAVFPLACLASSTSPRALRVSATAFLGILGAATLVVYAHRHLRYQPFRKQFAHYDAYVKRYAGAGWMEELTQPGDTIVHMGYGGWQYLTTHRHNGTAHTAVLNDERYMGRREMNRVVDNLRERLPTLMYFQEKGHQNTYFALDPTLAERYFWNGRGWERRVPPLPHDTLASAYRVKADDVLELVQHDQELSAVRKRKGKADVKLLGSVREHRVFLTGPGQTFLVDRRADGTLLSRDGRVVLQPLP